MTRVRFEDRSRYELAAGFAIPLGAVPDAGELALEAEAPLAALIGRVARGEPVALPMRHIDGDVWVIAAAARRDLEAALASVSSFVVPTYAEYAGGAPSHHSFDALGSDADQLLSSVYPAGYYLLTSPTPHFARLLERLARWAELEAKRPPPRVTQQLGYRDVLGQFNAALSAGAWDVAAEQIAEMRRRGLATADNLAFLGVQLLAQQRRWRDLWRREDFGDIARLRAPRAVRAALLAAFHQSELLPLEQAKRWPEALDTFRRLRVRLGGLLEGPADTTYGPALRAYAYREASAGDRAAVEQLAAQAPDEETRLAIEALLALLPPAPTASTTAQAAPALTPKQALHLALGEGHYGEAWSVAASIGNPTDQAEAMVTVAFYSQDPNHAEAALLHLWSLPPEIQEAMQRGGRHLRQMIAALSAMVEPPPAEAAEEPLTDWLGWLAAAVANPDDSRLAGSLELAAAADDLYWSGERVTALAERLIELVAYGTALGRPYLRAAVRMLRDRFLQDAEFPREAAAYADVYEALYTATLELREVNVTTTLALLRLAEARLRWNPAAAAAVAGHLTSWLNSPAPALGDAMLEALDLLAAYGAQGASFGMWLRSWVEVVLAAPRAQDRIALEAWLAFSEWAQPGPDLVASLRERLERLDTSDEDPIALLPDGYTIGIFTLRPQSVARVSELIRARNAGVHVRLCEDTVLTEQARALAQNADMCVVVTTCITHALTYGIGPYLRDPVYPQSSGSTSIMRAIEGRSRATRRLA